jgi:hypothetical protein
MVDQDALRTLGAVTGPAIALVALAWQARTSRIAKKSLAIALETHEQKGRLAQAEIEPHWEAFELRAINGPDAVKVRRVMLEVTYEKESGRWWQDSASFQVCLLGQALSDFGVSGPTLPWRLDGYDELTWSLVRVPPPRGVRVTYIFTVWTTQRRPVISAPKRDKAPGFREPGWFLVLGSTTSINSSDDLPWVLRFLQDESWPDDVQDWFRLREGTREGTKES